MAKTKETETENIPGYVLLEKPGGNPIANGVYVMVPGYGLISNEELPALVKTLQYLKLDNWIAKV